MKISVTTWAILVSLVELDSARAFVPQLRPTCSHAVANKFRASGDNGTESDADADADATRLRKQAQDLREQIRKMEEGLGENRPRNYDAPQRTAPETLVDQGAMSLKRKRVLVVGANGRLGSMVCRYLLRNNPQTEVIACVHYVGENSSTSRGYGRLSYEVGAEDGVGYIGAAWSAEERTATFEYADYMKDYNLSNLRLVSCELLDPVQCQTICEDVDSVIWCATDFDGNTPRALGLNFAFLFRAVADPTKGRVEIEGLRNILGGLKNAKQEQKRKGIAPIGGKEPIDFTLVSTTPEAFKDFETPYGTFNGIKREGEDLLKNEFPSLSYTILQMSRFEDNLVKEDLDILQEESNDGQEEEKKRRRINRRDAARAATEAMTNENLVGKTVQVWSDTR
jgi:hypothetical protein